MLKALFRMVPWQLLPPGHQSSWLTLNKVLRLISEGKFWKHRTESVWPHQYPSFLGSCRWSCER